ncbi:MAG: rane protein, superfamily [Geobacteraceae bacterium]|nr:rane protein, superfamily [Geobacteraceae bacterium]
MDRKIFFSLLTFSFLLFLFYVIYTMLQPFLVPLLWAIIIGVSTFPLYRRVLNSIHNRETLAASIITPIVVLLIVLPIVAMIFLLSKEAALLYNLFEASSASGRLSLESIQRHPFIESILERIAPVVPSLDIDLNSYFLPFMKKIASYLLSYSTEIIKNFFAVFLKIVLMVIALFFIYRDGERFFGEMMSIIPLRENDKNILVDTIKRVMSAVMYGIFMTCLLQGVLGGLGFMIFGLPSPILFGAMMAVAALIPVVGTSLIWLPGALYLIFQGEMLYGVLLIAWGVLIVSSIDNLIRPFFISGKAKLPILIIVLGVLGGLFSFGFIGIVTGPIILALFLDLFNIYKKQFIAGRRVTPAGSSHPR